MQKNQIKLSAVLLAILALGFILGAVSVQFIVENRIGRMNEMRNEPRFVHEFSRIIRPTGSQSEEIEAILKKYHQKLRKIRERNHAEHKEIMEAMIKDLTPLLTKDQLERLRQRGSQPPPHKRPHPEDLRRGHGDHPPPHKRPHPEDLRRGPGDPPPLHKRPHPEDLRRGPGDRPPPRRLIPFEKIDVNGDGFISGKESIIH